MREIRQQIAAMSSENQLQLLEELAVTVRHYLLAAQACEPRAAHFGAETSDLIQFLTRQPQRSASRTTIWEKMCERAARIPAEEWEQLLTDGTATPHLTSPHALLSSQQN